MSRADGVLSNLDCPLADQRRLGGLYVSAGFFGGILNSGKVSRMVLRNIRGGPG